MQSVGYLNLWDSCIFTHRDDVRYIKPAPLPCGGLGAGLGHPLDKPLVMFKSVVKLSIFDHLGAQMKALGLSCDPSVWRKKWGVNVQAFGSGENAVKYLGRYSSSKDTCTTSSPPNCVPCATTATTTPPPAERRR